jgi:hypothetical protein
MSRLLKRLSIKNGDILALKHQSENANQEAIDLIVKALTRLKIDALVIVVDDFEDLSILNETEMNKRGWFKLKSLAKIMRLPEKEVQ